MTTQELAQQILAKLEQVEGLKVTLSGNHEDIKKFWQSLNAIKQRCQEEVNKR